MQPDAPSDRQVNVVIAASGTAGHVKPALAIADELRADGATVSFIGTGTGSARGLVQSAGYEEDVVPMRGLSRRFGLDTFRTLWLTVAAVPRALRIVRRRRATVVIGAGGYMVGPVAIAAWLRRTPVVLTEADSHLGLANRLAAPLARRVALAYPIDGRHEPKFVVTGRPVDARIRTADRTTGRAALGVPEDAVCVLVTGGSQGARTLNTAIATAYRDGPPFWLVHIAGEGQIDDVRETLGGAVPAPNYRLIGYTSDFHHAVAAADLVVSRAGGTIMEIATVGRPSILVPYPHATGDHQTRNARWLVEAGAAELIPDDQCTPERLTGAIETLLADPARLDGMADAARRSAPVDAAQQIAKITLDASR